MNIRQFYSWYVCLSSLDIDRVLVYLRLVNFGTIGPVWHFSVAVEHARLSIDLFGLVQSTWK